eukprot:529132-Lingulodinium_polyedra.AAC.1
MGHAERPSRRPHAASHAATAAQRHYARPCGRLHAGAALWVLEHGCGPPGRHPVHDGPMGPYRPAAHSAAASPFGAWQRYDA